MDLHKPHIHLTPRLNSKVHMSVILHVCLVSNACVAYQQHWKYKNRENMPISSTESKEIMNFYEHGVHFYQETAIS